MWYNTVKPVKLHSMKNMDYCRIETVTLPFVDIENIKKGIQSNEIKKLFVIDLGSMNGTDPMRLQKQIASDTERLNSLDIPIVKNPRDLFQNTFSAVFALQFQHASVFSVKDYIEAGVGQFFFCPLAKILSQIKGNDWFDFQDIVSRPDILVDLRGKDRNDQVYNEQRFADFKQFVASRKFPVPDSTGLIIASKHHGNINVYFKRSEPLPVG